MGVAINSVPEGQFDHLLSFTDPLPTLSTDLLTLPTQDTTLDEETVVCVWSCSSSRIQFGLDSIVIDTKNNKIISHTISFDLPGWTLINPPTMLNDDNTSTAARSIVRDAFESYRTAFLAHDIDGTISSFDSHAHVSVYNIQSGIKTMRKGLQEIHSFYTGLYATNKEYEVLTQYVQTSPAGTGYLVWQSKADHTGKNAEESGIANFVFNDSGPLGSVGVR